MPSSSQPCKGLGSECSRQPAPGTGCRVQFRGPRWGQASGGVSPWESWGGRQAGLEGSVARGSPAQVSGAPRGARFAEREGEGLRDPEGRGQGRRSPARRKVGGRGMHSGGRTNNNNNNKERNEKDGFPLGRWCGAVSAQGRDSGSRPRRQAWGHAGPCSRDRAPCCRGHGAVTGCCDSPVNISHHPRMNRGPPDLLFSFCQAAFKKQQRTSRSPCKVASEGSVLAPPWRASCSLH